MKTLHWGMLVAALALGAFAWAKWGAMEDAGAPAEGRSRDEQARVRVKAEIDPTCPKDAPIRVTVQNNVDRALKTVDVHVGVYEEGQAEDLAASGPDEHWTTPIKALGSDSRCRALPPGPKKARYYFRAEKTGMAVFYSPGEEPR